ncbi:unnamed protein product [Bathycoccus prasinos]
MEKGTTTSNTLTATLPGVVSSSSTASRRQQLARHIFVCVSVCVLFVLFASMRSFINVSTFGGGGDLDDEGQRVNNEVWDGPVPEPTYEEGRSGFSDDDENDENGERKRKEKSDDDFVEFDTSLNERGKFNRDSRVALRGGEQQQQEAKQLFTNVPQNVCPGQPTKKGLDRLAGDGDELPPAVGPGGDESKYVNISCVYVTEKCANPTTAGGRGIMRRLKFNVNSEEDTKKFLKLAENLPSITEGALGSCAIVANSDNLLKGNRGAEIDMHDTVFRHNTPMKGFAKAIGTKTTFTIVKSNYAGGGGGAGKAQGKGDSKPELAYMLLKNIDLVPKSLKVEGRKVFLRMGGAHPIARLRRELYQLSGTPSKMHPTGGWARPLNLLASRLCERIDVYGFSGNNRGGKYFARKLEVRPAHNMPFEHWTMRYLMSKGKLVFSNVAPTLNAASSQSRADVIDVVMSATLILTGLTLVSIAPRIPETVIMDGYDVNYVDSSLSERCKEELRWSGKTLREAKMSGGKVVFYDGTCCAKDPNALFENETRQIGSVCKEVLTSGKQNYMANANLFPGRFEFIQDDQEMISLIKSNNNTATTAKTTKNNNNKKKGFGLPQNSQAICCVAVGDARLLVLSADRQRGFTKVDQAWFELVAQKLDNAFSSDE